MTVDEAKVCLNGDQAKPSEYGEAVDTLFREYGTYKNIAKNDDIERNAKFLSDRHVVFKLPKGVQWQVDKKNISLLQARQILRLRNGEDKWLFALTIVEKKLKPDECKNIIRRVRDGAPLKEALSAVAGVREIFDQGIPMVLMIQPEFLKPLTKLAWEQKQEWADVCYRLILQGLKIDMQDVSIRLGAIVSEINKGTGRAS